VQRAARNGAVDQLDEPAVLLFDGGGVAVAGRAREALR